MDLIAIYQNPSDDPGRFVVRQWHGVEPPAVTDTLGDARAAVRANPHPSDAPEIVETWR